MNYAASSTPNNQLRRLQHPHQPLGYKLGTSCATRYKVTTSTLPATSEHAVVTLPPSGYSRCPTCLALQLTTLPSLYINIISISLILYNLTTAPPTHYKLQINHTISHTLQNHLPHVTHYNCSLSLA